MLTPRILKWLYREGKNISSILREEYKTQNNTEEIIEISYDLQAGSYINLMQNEQIRQHKQEYAAEIARTFLALCNPSSILEAGVGEATTLSEVLKSCDEKAIRAYGFDLCWSRVAYAKCWLQQQSLDNVMLCTGDLFHIPFLDNSVDVVYTSHTIEPNRGGEAAILQELYRVTKKYLILLEPGYELASEQARERMDRYGYCRNLVGTAKEFEWEVVEHKLFPHTINPLNPTALTIIREKSSEEAFSDQEVADHIFACPQFKVPLRKIGASFFSPEALCVYPVLADIPCLRTKNAITASYYPDIVT
jgi:ubiquinone/menaquinone biosynthesis C-methylase UbiE